MKIYIITVRPPEVSDEGRYFDSLWVAKQHAEERCDQLKQELNRSGHRVWFTGVVVPAQWCVTVTEAHATDGQLADTEPESPTDKHLKK